MSIRHTHTHTHTHGTKTSLPYATHIHPWLYCTTFSFDCPTLETAINHRFPPTASVPRYMAALLGFKQLALLHDVEQRVIVVLLCLPQGGAGE